MPRVLRDITGQRFGLLTALKPTGQDANHSTLWLCHCDCGNYKTVSSGHLYQDHTRSCGCKKGTLIHGYARRKERPVLYTTWQGMRARCNNPKHVGYKNYGGRGIKICERWNDFENFAADMGERPPNTTLDRISCDGDYEPSNCRWLSKKEQRLNQRAKQLDQFTTTELVAEIARRNHVILLQ